MNTEATEGRALQLCCNFPGCAEVAARRHQITAYDDEESNWNELCLWHQAEADAYWQERWSDYYAGLL